MKNKSKFLLNRLSKYWQGAESHSSNPYNPYTKLIKTQFQNTPFPSPSAESHSSTPIDKPIDKPVDKPIPTSTNK